MGNVSVNDATRAWVRYYFTQYDDDRTRPQITIRGLQGAAVAAPAVRRPIVNPTSATEFGYAGYRGPLKGLYHCGSGAHPGGGVTGAPGHNAARAIISDRRWKLRPP